MRNRIGEELQPRRMARDGAGIGILGLEVDKSNPSHPGPFEWGGGTSNSHRSTSNIECRRSQRAQRHPLNSQLSTLNQAGFVFVWFVRFVVEEELVAILHPRYLLLRHLLLAVPPHGIAVRAADVFRWQRE